MITIATRCGHERHLPLSLKLEK
jgi:hypothetical protein